MPYPNVIWYHLNGMGTQTNPPKFLTGCRTCIIAIFPVTIGPCKLVCFDLVWPFLQSVFHLCYLGCRSNRFCLENSLGSEVSLYLHPWIIVDESSHVLTYIWLLKGSLKSHQMLLLHCVAPDRDSSKKLIWLLIPYRWQWVTNADWVHRKPWDPW